jgi:Zn-dependent protease
MLHLGSIRGTSIDVDFSFFILVGLFALINYNEALGIEYALIWIPIVFVSVLVHELAHAGMIGLLGFGASQVILGGMGGVTINARRAKAWQDLLISLAGPFSSFGLMLLCMLLQSLEVARTDRMLQVLLPSMVWANLAWGIFNLIPVPPLDGGHATRDFFRMFLDERRAFIVAIWIAMIVGGLFVGLFLWQRQFFIAVFIGLYVYRAFVAWQYFRQHGIPGD